MSSTNGNTATLQAKFDQLLIDIKNYSKLADCWNESVTLDLKHRLMRTKYNHFDADAFWMEVIVITCLENSAWHVSLKLTVSWKSWNS